MSIKRKITILLLLSLAVSIVSASVFWAASNAGAFWSNFDSRDYEEEDFQSGFLVVNALSSRYGILEGVGPFLPTEPSFGDPELVLMEDGEEIDINATEPIGSETSEIKEPAKWVEITVAPGEVLSKIAEKYGISAKEIMRINGIADQNKIRQGEVLIIPTSVENIEATLAYLDNSKHEEIERKKQAATVKLIEYLVKDGDTLWSIANAFDLDINSLFGCNKLPASNVLKVGATIVIPNQDGILYTVKSGQTVEKIAKEYGIYPEAIVSANKLVQGTALAAGKEIFLPGAKISIGGDLKKAVAASTKEAASNSKFMWPLQGRVSSQYGWRRDPISKSKKDFHTGLDIAAPRGRAVVAAMGGKVVHSGWMGGYGNTVVIQHPNGLTSLYGHNSSLTVKKGATVKRGQKIALVGSTGRSTGNHVHFEIRRNGTTLNPLKYLK